MNRYTVYKHTCPNEKVYIGITQQEPKNRWLNGHGYKKQIFYRAILKYGWENIKHEILYSNVTEAVAKEKEIELISKYNSTNPKYGYNVVEGGQGTTGYHHTEKSKEKMRNLKLGKTLSKDHVLRISQAHRMKCEFNFSKLTVAQVLEIKNLLINTDISFKDISVKYNVNQSHIEKINKKEIWQHIKIENDNKYKRYRDKNKTVLNSKRANSKLNEEIVKEIRIKFMNGASNKEIMQLYNLSKSTVKELKLCKSWGWVKVEGYNPEILKQKVFDDEVINKALDMVSKGKTYKYISETLGVSQASVCRWVKIKKA